MSNLNNFLAPGQRTSYEVNSIAGAIDITKRNHFVTPGVDYTLADGTYVGQELYFWKSGVGSGACVITVTKAKHSLTGANTTTSETAFAWKFSEVGNNNRQFYALWDGAGWCLSGGEKQ